MGDPLGRVDERADPDAATPVMHQQRDVVQVQVGHQLFQVGGVVHVHHLEAGLIRAPETDVVHRDDAARVPEAIR